jgi:hypothetical protein
MMKSFESQTLPSRATIADVRDLVLDLAVGAPIGAGRCRHWDIGHKNIVLSHHLGPWLHQKTQALAASELPMDLAHAFGRSFRSSVAACLAREAVLRRLLPMFRSSSVPVVLLKGLYLQEHVYEDTALRPMCDVDFLVRSEDFVRAQQVLEEAEYHPAVERPPMYPAVLLTVVPYSRFPSFGPPVDLHRGLRLLDGYIIDPVQLWNEAAPGSIHDQDVLFLSPEMNFIHLGMHALTHGALVRDHLDLLLIISETGLDWGRLSALARTLGVERPLYWILRSFHGPVNEHVPSDVISSLQTYRPRWIEDRMIRSPISRLWRMLSRFGLIDGWGARLGYVRLLMFASRASCRSLLGTSSRRAYCALKLGSIARVLSQR